MAEMFEMFWNEAAFYEFIANRLPVFVSDRDTGRMKTAF
jgi:hypothetical protein